MEDSTHFDLSAGDLHISIRVDITGTHHQHDDSSYQPFDERSLDQLASLVADKLRLENKEIGKARRQSTSTKQVVAFLTNEETHVIGIMVGSQLPLPIGLYEKLFDKLAWQIHVKRLISYKLVRRTGDALRPTQAGIKIVHSDAPMHKACTDEWVKRLEELKDHPDIALYLAPHYMGEKRWDDAVRLFADLGNAGLHGHWNETFLKYLGYFAEPRIVRRLKPETRIHLFHALAICFSQAAQYTSSLAWFAKVRKESTKARDLYWIGQCHLNSGVALDHSGDKKRAAVAYQAAVSHGEQHNDPLLAGRALGNLAQLRMSQGEPDAAIDLIRKSISLKKQAEDESGTAMSAAQLGAIEAHRGNLREALGHFAQAEALFAKQGMVYEQAKTIYNIGNAYCRLGQLGKALQAFRKSFRLTIAEEDFIDLTLIATQGIAQACHKLKRFAEIEQAFKALSNSPAALKHVRCIFSSYLGIGIAQVFQGRTEEGRDNLGRALKLARKSDKPEWTVQVLTALAGISDDGTVENPSPGRLTRLAAQEEKRERWSVAADLWDLAAETYAKAGQIDDAELAYESVRRCLTKCDPKGSELVTLHFTVFAWRWVTGRYERAIEALDQAEKIAESLELEDERVKAIDEKGLAFQKLNRVKEALPLHKRAVRMSEKQNLPTQLRISLNNLGQAHRGLGHTKDAVSAFENSEALAREVGEHSEALGTMVNRGLAIQEGGDHKNAGAILTRCAAEAKRRESWKEYVMAEEARGNLAWHKGLLALTEKHYKRALEVAKTHRVKRAEIEIAVNYASLLDQTGKAKQALKLLRAYESHFDKMSRAYVCHEVLGGLYWKNRDREAAKTHWEKGKSHALAVSNDDYVALCSSSLADAYEEEGRFDLAEKELETAISHEDESEGRAILLSRLLRIELALGNEKKIEDTFNEVRAIAQETKLTDTLIDIHICLADHRWRGDMDSKQEAIKAYFVAVLETLSKLDLNGVPDVFGHIVLHLTNAKHAPTEDEFETLLGDLKRELPKVTKKNARGLGFVLWPFESARRLLPLRGDQVRFEAEARKLTKEGFGT